MSLLNQTTLLFSHLSTTTNTTSSKTLSKTLNPFFFFPKPTKINSYNNIHQQQHQHEEEEHVIGDCLVFEQGIFDDPFIQTQIQPQSPKPNTNTSRKPQVKPEDLVPENWKDIQAEINITKKERRKMAQQMEFGTKLQKRKEGLKPIPIGYATAKEYKAAKLRESKPLVLDNPKMAVYGRSLDDISKFLNSGRYDPDAAKDPQGARKLFSKEEKILMNRRIPDLAVATSGKWQPLHTLAASGEFYLVDTLMKYNVDINVPNQEGLTAIHKAILGKKHAICNYLLRNSANPFVRDRDGATLMHYAVRTASTQMIKVLLLYNVDINLQDNDGWTPLHLAVQARRTDVVRLLLIKKADITLKNHDGLTPLDLCLYSGRDARTYELIRLLKLPPKPRKYAQLTE